MANYKNKTDVGECIFCEIAKGKIKPLGDSLIWEDKNYMAWLSPFPNTEGFAMIIPKKHYASDVLKMDDKALANFILAAKKVAKLLEDYFKDVGRVGLIMEGTGIDHAHIKLVPMHGTGHMKKGIWKRYNSEKSEYFKKYAGYLSSADGPMADFKKLKKMAEKIKTSI
ncbi:MAG: HIT family protein [Parcubacteria group bacterium]|jgi:diadenosine tetraphosphate (Ap4A) HIT family hydrolase